jgi:prepilin-type processing-associated H-X9-DG protein
LKDGTTATLMVAEKRLNLSFLGQWQEDDNEGYSAGWDEDTIRRTGAQPAPDYGAPSGDGGELFGSSHSGIFNAVFADGSVHPISYTIDKKVFGYLGHITDGQTANPFP